MQVQIVGKPISSFSRALIVDLALEANIAVVHVTSVKRTVIDQARQLIEKHVVQNVKANYKNPDVTALIEESRNIYHSNTEHPDLQGATSYLAKGILNLKGGPESASRHLIMSPFVEVFDIAHYSLHGGKRTNWLSHAQAVKLLSACRKRYGFPISKLGVSAELKPSGRYEFKDEKCFHFEVLQPIMNEGSHYMDVA